MPRKRSAKPTDADFRGDQQHEPQLMKGEVQVAEEPKPSLTNGAKTMPIIDFSEFGLDDVPELKILPAGSEAKLRILNVELKPDKNGDMMLQLRLDIADDPSVKDIYWQRHFPNGKMADRRLYYAKQDFINLCEAFELNSSGINDTSEWLGKEAWAILSVRSDEKYGESNEVARWLKQQ